MSRDPLTSRLLAWNSTLLITCVAWFPRSTLGIGQDTLAMPQRGLSSELKKKKDSHAMRRQDFEDLKDDARSSNVGLELGSFF